MSGNNFPINMVIHDDSFRHFANKKTLYFFTLMKILTLLKHFVYQILNFKFKYTKMQTEIRYLYC